ncbi:methylated-DNA--[protein]-cysteine S-methyltransferase [Pontixanthobacter gangjinensis]|uniref:Methylated-DNA--protein-cysteine methyltransferase n=1 Tax=Christiangramia aestuarii TaxID=1028746 RepID=A0A7K1LR58_9FLAO|nr:methylated-DNA--[protein]-cysteine S-methyltransferase [Christiangramia aestuarii]MUP43295.1 methylated-DNA--[protein]-cysteine S-methyltransferase [Christiangramia aestuarii]
MKKARIKTPLGIAEITGDSNGLTSIKVLDEGAVSNEIPAELLPAVNQLQDYFKGKLLNFDLRINPEGTDFQKKVWNKLTEIPYATTISYLELSRQLGDEKAIRAVAAANGKNPLWIVVPCHRVIGSDGSLTGYAGGLSRKKWLLELENPPVQQSLF